MADQNKKYEILRLDCPGISYFLLESCQRVCYTGQVTSMCRKKNGKIERSMA